MTITSGLASGGFGEIRLYIACSPSNGSHVQYGTADMIGAQLTHDVCIIQNGADSVVELTVGSRCRLLGRENASQMSSLLTGLRWCVWPTIAVSSGFPHNCGNHVHVDMMNRLNVPQCRLLHVLLSSMTFHVITRCQVVGGSRIYISYFGPLPPLPPRA